MPSRNKSSLSGEADGDEDVRPGKDDRSQARPEGITDLVAAVLDRLESDGPRALEELCRAHPGHAADLRQRVEQLRAIGFVGSPRADAPLPERIGDFRILGRLGGGGMGVVLLAEQEGLARQVALKLVRPDLLYFPGARERFRREVEAVARLAHPGIVPVHAGGEDNGLPYYAMERVRGASLEELIVALAGRDPARLTGPNLRRAVEQLTARRESGLGGAATGRAHATGVSGAHPGGSTPAPSGPATPASPRTATSGRGGTTSTDASRLFAGSWSSACLRIARSVALALQHAHEQGVLHRDVKPSNIMLTPDGRVLLLDFGLAAAEGSERITGSGAQMGSLAWMSPEQVRGEHASLDARTDVYSLGATLYELLSLRSPFTGGDTEATRQRILQGRLIPLRDLNPSIPRDAETVCLVAMDRERERRYPDAAAFAADLDNALELRPVLARRPGPVHRLRRWAQRNPARALASVLGAVLIIGGPLGYGFLESRAADEQRRLNDELNAGRERLQLALAEETRQRESSERGYRRTLDAVDQMLWQVGSSDLENVPGFEDTRIALLDRALGFYRELATEQPGDTVPRLEHLRTERSIADILLELGRRDEAAAAFEGVISGLRALLAEAPGDDETRRMLAGALSQQGAMQQQAGHLDAAEASLTESLAIFDALVAQPDPQPDWMRDRISTSFNLALVANNRGDDAEELRLFLDAAEIATRLTAAHPQSVDYAVHLAATLGGAANASGRQGHGDEAERLHRAGWDMMTKLLPGNPHDRALRSQIVETANNLGVLLLSRADRDEALAVLGTGLEAARSLAQDFPREPDCRRNAAVLGINLSAELGNQQRFAEAAPVIEESCAQLERLAADDPGNVSYGYFLGVALAVASGMHLALDDPGRALQEGRAAVDRMRATRATLGDSTEVGSQLANALFQFADVLRATAEHPGALEACEEAYGLVGEPPDILFLGSQVTARLAAAARAAGEPADGTGATALADRARELSLSMLDSAVTNGFRDAARLRDQTFAILQGDPRFEAIARRLAGAP